MATRWSADVVTNICQIPEALGVARSQKAQSGRSGALCGALGEAASSLARARRLGLSSKRSPWTCLHMTCSRSGPCRTEIMSSGLSHALALGLSAGNLLPRRLDLLPQTVELAGLSTSSRTWTWFSASERKSGLILAEACAPGVASGGREIDPWDEGSEMIQLAYYETQFGGDEGCQQVQRRKTSCEALPVQGQKHAQVRRHIENRTRTGREGQLLPVVLPLEVNRTSPCPSDYQTPVLCQTKAARRTENWA